MAPSTARSGAAAAVAQQQRGSSSGGGNGGVLALAGLSVFVFSIYAGALLPVIAIARLLAYGLADATGWALLAAVAALTLAPIEWCDVPAARAAVGAICRAAVDYFPIKVILEDEDAMKAATPYVLGYEPHSALPVGIPSVFSTPSPALPKFLRGGRFHGLASGVCFQVALVRQLWWLLGLRPATREGIDDILAGGGSVLLCPGGVQECLHMERDSELAFLRSRRGFVRAALKRGAALVPVFAFGQGGSFSWLRPGPPLFPQAAVKWLSRHIGAVPLVIRGRWWTPMPHTTPIKIVIGRPIETPPPPPRLPGERTSRRGGGGAEAPRSGPATPPYEPPAEMVEEYLEKFIVAMQAMFEAHKAGTPCENMSLRVM